MTKDELKKRIEDIIDSNQISEDITEFTLSVDFRDANGTVITYEAYH